MLNISDSLENLVDQLVKLPQIGRKTAQRLALFLIKQPKDEIEKLSDALLLAKSKIKFCSVCCNITEDEVCKICSSNNRDRSLLCVVEEPSDVYVIEKTNEYKGLYHVLHGRISPLEGIGPEDIRVRELLMRINGDNKENINELILALNPTVEGETTILYLSKLLKHLDMKITRIARGIPVGVDIELTDTVTLAKAIENRVSV
jgi:recombination protein RecR